MDYAVFKKKKKEAKAIYLIDDCITVYNDVGRKKQKHISMET